MFNIWGKTREAVRNWGMKIKWAAPWVKKKSVWSMHLIT